MRVLFVASYNKGYYAPFIVEQAEALQECGCKIEFFGVTGKGIKGYVSSFPSLKDAIKRFSPDIIHAHYGLCGLLANLQRKIPVVTTYHGSDINEKSVLPFSKIAIALSRFNIFVSQRTIDIAKPHKDFALLPCGVDLNDLQLTDKKEARSKMGLEQGKKYVLFAGAFDNPVKNYPLAIAAMGLIPEAELIELKGYTRDQVTLLMCAADALLMTSFTEGSPQVVKEAMACGCPIVSVDVGDVPLLLSDVENCLIITRNPEQIATCLKSVFGTRSNGRSRICELNLENKYIIEKLSQIYNNLVK